MKKLSYNDWMDYIHDCIKNNKTNKCKEIDLQEYHRLRNVKYKDYVKRGLIIDTDENWEKFDVSEYEYCTSTILWD